MNYEEQFAFENADQYLGCSACKKSHHISSVCKNCYRCFFVGKRFPDKSGMFADVVKCKCGKTYIWD